MIGVTMPRCALIWYQSSSITSRNQPSTASATKSRKRGVYTISAGSQSPQSTLWRIT